MSSPLPPLRLTGATVLRDRELQDRTVAIAEGRISAGPFPAIDLSGYFVLPGIIDLHGDAFERHSAPRPSAPFPWATGLRATDRDAAANGVTTAWLAQGWSWEGGHRSPDAAEAFITAHEAYKDEALTDLRVQIRYETHEHDTADRLLDCVRRHGIDYIVFNNHLDDALDTAERAPQDFAGWAARNKMDADSFRARIAAAKGRGREVPRRLCKLAEAFDALGVLYGSHDDPDGETREMYSMLGAKICEFPTSFHSASVARAVGDPVLMGAPNIVRGGSQAGNISAAALVRAGKCDALVSDYYYPALAQAAFRLVDDGILPLPEAWRMISETPAQILRLTDRGVVAPGKRADLTIIHKDSRRIEATISAGRISHLSGEAAHRFIAGMQGLQLAAE